MKRMSQQNCKIGSRKKKSREFQFTLMDGVVHQGKKK